MYNDLIKNINNIVANLTINFIQGPKVEIKSPIDAEYLIEFYDSKTKKLMHSSVIKNNHWTKCLYQYFIDWHIKIYQKEYDGWTLVKEDYYNNKGKKVYIALDSKAVGDTIAWFPYIEEFRKKHECKVVCSTFHNNLFKKQYPELEFIEPGETTHNLYAMYTIGWFYKDQGVINTFKHPQEVKNQNLQKTASDILGIDYTEVKPNILKTTIKSKEQIAIAIHGTAQAKYWNNPTGWQEVTDWCLANGYEVLLLSKEGDTYMGNNHPTGIKQISEGSLENVVEELRNSKAFIGISSGLSWLSWAVGTSTVLVSGFSEPYTEPESCYRIGAPKGKCSGCFNTHQLDAGDWNWCPMHKGTERQFECTKSITAEEVINQLKYCLKKD